MAVSEGLGKLIGDVTGLFIAIVGLGMSVTLMLRLLHYTAYLSGSQSQSDEVDCCGADSM
jgi:hypothetical protein